MAQLRKTAPRKQSGTPGALNTAVETASVSFLGLLVSYLVSTCRFAADRVMAAFIEYGDVPTDEIPTPPKPRDAFVQAMAYLSQRGGNPKARMVDGALRAPLLDGKIVTFTAIDSRSNNGKITYRVNVGSKSSKTEDMPCVGSVAYDNGLIFEGEIAADAHPLNAIIRQTHTHFAATVSDMDLRTAIVKRVNALAGLRVKGATTFFVRSEQRDNALALRKLIRSATGDESACITLPVGVDAESRESLVPAFLADFADRLKNATADVEKLFTSLTDGKRGARRASFADQSIEINKMLADAAYYADLFGASADSITAGLTDLKGKLDKAVNEWGTGKAVKLGASVADDSGKDSGGNNPPATAPTVSLADDTNAPTDAPQQSPDAPPALDGAALDASLADLK